MSSQAQMPPCRVTEGPILTDSMMARFAARAPDYDRDNREGRRQRPRGSTDKPVPADHDGDGKADVAVTSGDIISMDEPSRGNSEGIELRY